MQNNARSLVGRDPFLIAYARAEQGNRTVVTVEASKPSCRRANRRIPDVCNDLGIQWCNSFQMMAALDFTTTWKARSGTWASARATLMRSTQREPLAKRPH